MSRLSKAQIKQARIASFLQLAREELESARYLMDPLPKQSAFFMQQSVEKLLRAVLEQEECLAGITHNIEALAALLPAQHPLRSVFMSFDDISGAATRFRYPTETGNLRAPDISAMPGRLADIEDLQKRVIAFIHNK
jgi:HEPN domain-containing protein